MSAEDTEHENLMDARERVQKGEYHNSLVAWTLSKEWTQVPLKHKVRGEVWLSGQKCSGTCNSCDGEIDAKTEA